MKCERCGYSLSEEDSYNYRGKILCEDCYMGALQPPKSCDVAAVHSAKTHRKLAGQTGTEGLTDLQRDIYNTIKKEEKITRQDLMKKFNLRDWELEKQIAILRHCELVKAHKDGDQIYIVLFDY